MYATAIIGFTLLHERYYAYEYNHYEMNTYEHNGTEYPRVNHRL